MAERIRRSWLAVALAALFGGAGVLAIGAGLAGAGKWLWFAAKSQSAEGVVERVDEVRRRRSVIQVPVLRFRAHDGRDVLAETRSTNSWARFAPGDRVSLRYDPDDPSRAEVDPIPLLILSPLLAVPFGGVFVGFGRALLGGRPPSFAPMRLVIVSLLSLFVLLALFVFGNELAEALARQRGTVVTEARVVGFREGTRNTGGGPRVTIMAPVFAFTTAEGREMRLESSDFRERPSHRVGDTLRIRYRPSQPARAQRDGVLGVWLRPLVFGGVVMAVLAGVAVILFNLERLRARMTYRVT